MYCFTIFPFTACLTLTATLVLCNVVFNETSIDDKPHWIFELNNDGGYVYFVVGFVLIFVQLLVVLLGRVQYLFQSQMIVRRNVLLINHLFGFIGLIFMLIMSCIKINDHRTILIVCVLGMLICLIEYCCHHTIVIIYLYVYREDAPQHSNIFYPIWFVICSLLILVVLVVWLITGKYILGYCSFASPFLYFLGFVPQYCSRARGRKRDSVAPTTIFFKTNSDV